MKKIVIAIDGHSSCGKSTMAKALARRVGYIYVDSGAMYRAVTLHALRHGLFAPDGSLETEMLREQMPQIEVSFRLDPETQLPQTYLNGECVEEAIRSLEVSNHVSPVAALPFVREAMTAQQQAMGRAKGIVMDGRDIGTAVFPDAELKIFVTASAEVRARRRYDELQAKGMAGDYGGDSQERAGARLHRLAPRNEPLASSSRCAGARQLVPHPRTTERLALDALRRGHPRRLTARTGLSTKKEKIPCYVFHNMGFAVHEDCNKPLSI